MKVDSGDISIPNGLTVITGGARSGKSALAQKIGEAWRGQVCFVATATAGDEDMAERIARHRRERPASWTTMESPVEVASDIRGVPEGSLVIIDCVTMWVSNLLLDGFEVEKVEVPVDSQSQKMKLVEPQQRKKYFRPKISRHQHHLTSNMKTNQEKQAAQMHQAAASEWNSS